MAVWLPLFEGEVAVPTLFAPRDWHAHEMLFGYVPAVLTGFLLTAIPNWTGRLPLQGMPLLFLVIVWAAGRFAVSYSAHLGWLLTAMIDCGFLVLVVGAAAREIVAGQNWRNLKVLIPGDDTCARQCRISCRGICLRRGAIRAQDGVGRDTDSGHADRRANRSQFHT
jgi:uncharacterized protein involved in response to NO